ncbi:hypothetical protein BOTBODRAFT_410588 [Botryobasidium botryosum FD-172 SS1]|uniref:Uncharacterized protein n=1 Tax=Botryobasidium botryosum (strain FD-172 SS1) TaxID=930990 RepID=A0A067MMJ7_BOTB1|nr:hypothetical protein BOTBODRAFT_410588 [Botryobasidium botryosum FD-172 SS1]
MYIFRLQMCSSAQILRARARLLQTILKVASLAQVIRKPPRHATRSNCSTRNTRREKVKYQKKRRKRDREEGKEKRITEKYVNVSKHPTTPRISKSPKGIST